MNLIIYIHICQLGDWKRSLTMLMNSIVISGLYDAVTEIRCGVLNDSRIRGTRCHVYEDDYILHQCVANARASKTEKTMSDFARSINMSTEHSDLGETKMKIVHIGEPHEYERPTLLHMRNSISIDPVDTKYLYLHTKGLKWFGTSADPSIVSWIKMMLYWNVEHWRNAVDVLNKYDTYGCDYHNSTRYPSHYSGNFFWTTSHHLESLPAQIGPAYNDTEFWLCSNGRFPNKPNLYNAFSSEDEPIGHYSEVVPESLYRK